jgi:hypothetical protein
MKKSNQGTAAPSSDEEVFVFPLSFSQQRLWFFEQLVPGSAVYNLSQTLRLRGPLESTALQRSLNELVRRHEVLRTTFMAVEGSPLQVIGEAFEPELAVIDLTGIAERESQTRRLLSEEANGPFDLQQGPLLRAKLFRMHSEEHLLLLTMHHIVSDGWSMDVLERELTLLYRAYAAGAPSPLPELPIQYADFALWQRATLQGDLLQQELAYWQRKLAGAPQVLELPADRLRPPIQSYRGASASLLLDASIALPLRALARQEGATLFMVLLAGFSVLLSRYSGQNDLIVGTPIANRTRSELEGLIGFFVNTLALRLDLSGEPSFVALLARIKDVTTPLYRRPGTHWPRTLI